MWPEIDWKNQADVDVRSDFAHLDGMVENVCQMAQLGIRMVIVTGS